MLIKSNRLLSIFMAFFMCFNNLVMPVVAEGEDSPEVTEEPVVEVVEEPVEEEDPEVTEEVTEEQEEELTPEEETGSEEETEEDPLEEEEPVELEPEEIEEAVELDPEESEIPESAVLYSSGDYDITASVTPYHNYAYFELNASTSYNNLYIIWTENNSYEELTGFVSTTDLDNQGINYAYLSINVYRNSSTGLYEGSGNWIGTNGLTPDTDYFFQIVRNSEQYVADYGYISGYEPLSELYSFKTTENIQETSTNQFRYQSYNSYVTIEKYIGNDTEVIIPSLIDGITVTNISNGAFMDNTTITKVVIPATVTSLSSELFSGCTNLSTLVIPKSVSNIPWGVIDGCTKLKSLGPVGSDANLQISFKNNTINNYSSLFTYLEEAEIGDEVVAIGNNAFSNKSNLRTVTIGRGVTSIGNAAFRYTGITLLRFYGDAPLVPPAYIDGVVNQNAIVDPANVILVYEEGTSGWTSGVWNGYYAKSSAEEPAIAEGTAGSNITWMITGTENNLTLQFTGTGDMYDYQNQWNGSESVITAGWGPYSDQITKILLSDGITRIGSYAFYDMDRITRVDLPDSLTAIGHHAFQSCDSLIRLPMNQSLVSIEAYAFSGNERMTGQISFPDTLTSIGEWAFSNCKNLSGNLVIPNSVIEIGSYAFSQCGNLHGTLALSNQLTKIADNAFSSCKFIGELSIPESVTIIGDDAFYGNYFTGNLTIPQNVKSIGNRAFSDCYTLQGSLTLPTGLLSIGDGAFAYHQFTGDLIIPDTVITIGSYAFSTNECIDPQGCSYGSEIPRHGGFDGRLVLPNTLTSIGEHTFEYNHFNGQLNIPDTVETIGSYAFRGTTFSGILTLPTSLVSIGNYAFYDTKFDDNTVIPHEVVSIGANAFRKTSNLVHFTFEGDSPTVIPADNNESSFDASDLIFYSEDSYGFTSPKWNGYTTYPAGTATTNGVTIQSDDFILLNGAALQLRAVVTPSNAVDKNVIWSVDNSNYNAQYFQVDQTGLVTTTWDTTSTQGQISTVIKVTTKDGGYTDTIQVYAVKGNLIRATGAQMQKTQYRMIPGSSYDLKLRIKPGGSDYNKVPTIYDATWTSSDPSVVSVSSRAQGNVIPEGKTYYRYSINTITAHKPGTATITAVTTDGGYTATCEVTVLDQASGIIIDYTELTLNQGDTMKMSGYVVGEEEEDSSLVWSSVDPGIVSIDSDGNLTAVGGGTTSIIARSSDGSTAACTVTVLVPVRNLSLDITSLTLSEGDTARLNAVITPYDATDPDVVWSTSNENVVTVDQGLVTAVMPGSAYITVSSVNGNLTAECLITVRESEVPAEDIPEEGIPAGVWIAGVEEKTYTGAALKQDIHVYDGNVLLSVNKDYKVTYKNNKNAGTASVIVTMKGNYTGTITQTFEIIPLSLTEASIDAGDIYTLVNGTVQKKVPVVTNGKVKLKNERDFILSYDENSDFTEAGEHYITVQGIGNYKDEIIVTEHISDASNTMISKASVNKIGTQTYTGSEIEPVVTVKYKKVVLSEGVDYEVSYANNINIGTGTVIITGIGEYTGIKKVSFKIGGVPMKKVMISGLYTSAEYTGDELTQDDAELMYGDQLLTEGEDYRVSYTKNVNAGTAKVTYTGMGGYTGSVTKSFKITKTSIEEADVEDQDNIIVEFTQGGATPKPTLFWKGMELKEKKDYTLKYSNNKAGNNGSDPAKTPMITITGKGNFSGKISVPFIIAPKNLNQTTMMVKDKVYSTKANGYKASVTIMDTNGKKLKVNKDYNSPEYSWKNTQVPPVGTTIFASVTGKGNYTGRITASYRIIAASQDINKAQVTAQSKNYTGRAVTLNPNTSNPANGDLVILLNGQYLTYGRDYEIVGYTKNINKGTATVTIRGIGQYGGEKTIKFKIVQRNVNY